MSYHFAIRLFDVLIGEQTPNWRTTLTERLPCSGMNHKNVQVISSRPRNCFDSSFEHDKILCQQLECRQIMIINYDHYDHKITCIFSRSMFTFMTYDADAKMTVDILSKVFDSKSVDLRISTCQNVGDVCRLVKLFCIK